MTTKPILSQLTVGTRVRLVSPADRYPNFIVMPGGMGTVADVSDECLWVKMDEHIDGAEEWDNCIEWYLPCDDPCESLSIVEYAKDA